MTMADRIVVLNQGQVEQVGTPVELYARPRNLFVAGFLGAPPMNLISGTLQAGSVRLDNGTAIPLTGRSIPLPDGSAVTLGIRPEHVELAPGPLRIRVTATEVLGSETIVHASTVENDTPFTIVVRGISRLKAADVLQVALPAEFIHLFDKSGIAVGASEDWRQAYLR
jgi:multiple sugar transport system ATP-binding protein